MSTSARAHTSLRWPTRSCCRERRRHQQRRAVQLLEQPLLSTRSTRSKQGTARLQSYCIRMHDSVDQGTTLSWSDCSANSLDEDGRP